MYTTNIEASQNRTFVMTFHPWNLKRSQASIKFKVGDLTFGIIGYYSQTDYSDSLREIELSGSEIFPMENFNWRLNPILYLTLSSLVSDFTESEETSESGIRLLSFYHQHNWKILDSVFNDENTERLTQYHLSRNDFIYSFLSLQKCENCRCKNGSNSIRLLPCNICYTT